MKVYYIYENGKLQAIFDTSMLSRENVKKILKIQKDNLKTI